MSIVDGCVERVFPVPKRQSVRPVMSAKIRARNRRWLRRKRDQALSVRELARLVRKPVATVAAGVQWAGHEEARAARRAVAAARSPTLDAFSGLTADDVVYLVTTYPPETELGSHPMFWTVLGPLVDTILGDSADEAHLFSPQAA